MDLLKADLKKLYRNYLVPSLSAAIVTSVYSFVDMIAIGRGVGPNGAAALSIATPIFGVISFFGLLCGVGSSVYLGKARGEGRMEKSNAYFSASLLLTAIFTALVWGGFNLFSVQIYSIFGAKESLMPFVKTYTDLIVWTMPLFIFSSYFSCMVRSDGAPSRVMAAVMIGGVFNIFGDWFFVFPMDWGMAGAALATVCGTIVQFIILCSHFFSKNCLLKVVKPFRPARAFRNVLIAGFSAGVIDIAFIVLTVILNKQILRYGGEATLAVFGVVITCSSMFQHLFSGVGQAIQPIVSMNFGAGQIKRIQELDRLSAVTALSMGVVFSLVGLLFPLQLTTFFVDATPEILSIAPRIIRIYFLSFLPMGINIQATYYLQAVMKTYLSNLLALLRGLVFSGILVYLLPLLWGVDGIWWAMALAEFMVVILSVICLRMVDRRAEEKLNENKELFEKQTISKAVISLVVPTVISQLITVAYNMADTFFIGQVGDPNQVAAVSLCMPLFILLTGMANLFGIGGSSLISRSLGEGNLERAGKVSAFCIWSAGIAALFYGLSVFGLRGHILPLVGANGTTYDFCSQYILWAIAVGAVPTVLNAAFAHLVRAEGYSKQASFGMALGGILNMILDPIFISLLGFEVAGAAIATMLSNFTAAIYFIMLIFRKRETTVLSLDPRCYTWEANIPVEVLLVGLPSCVMNLMGVFSNIVMNRLMVSYCNEAVAGIGIAKKIDMLAFAIATGMSQGVLPLIGYNYSSKNFKRMKAAVKTTFLYSLVMALAGTAFLLTCAGVIVRAFIDDPLTVEYGGRFQRIICITCPCISVTMIIITLFQATGKKVRPLVLSLLRKGGLDIPAILLMNQWIGLNGIAWATPIADFTAMVLALCLFFPFWRSLCQELDAEVQA